MTNSSTPPNNQKAPIWIGLLSIAFGILPIILNVEPTAGTPMWIAYVACSVFIFAGFTVIFPLFAKFFGPLIILTFALISTWIGFSSDAKHCTSSISIGFFTDTKHSSGCGPFAISAVICWLLFLWVTFDSLKKFIKKK